jgi:Icc protein
MSQTEAIYARSVLVAQLSDTHLLADPNARLWSHNTTRNLAAVIDALPPRVDVMVITGDVAEDGTHEAYRRALSMTAGRADERYFLAGNHDDPNVMREVIGPPRPLRMVRISERWTMALLDSQWVGHDAGQIARETLTHLQAELDQVTTYVVACVHHPPVSPCHEPDCGVSNGDALLEILRTGPVRLVLSGHVHQHFDKTLDGIRFVGAPSTFRQLRHGGDPHYTDTLEPPAAQLVELFDDGEVSCDVIRAASGDYDAS